MGDPYKPGWSAGMLPTQHNPSGEPIDLVDSTSPPRESADNFIAQQEIAMESVINEDIINIEIILRNGVVSICAASGYEAESDLLKDHYTWENACLHDKTVKPTYEACAEAIIKKFCELEGIKQEFKGSQYRMIGKWRSP
jgi:hypothetical protein